MTRFGLVLLLLANLARAEPARERVVLVAVSANDGVAVVAQGQAQPILLREGDALPGGVFVVSEIGVDAIMVRELHGDTPFATALVPVGSAFPEEIKRPFPVGDGPSDAVVKGVPANAAAAPEQKE